MFPPSDPEREHLVGYRELRTLVGVVGLFTPALLALGGLLKGIPLQPSLSAYYHTHMHVLFIGSLWVIAFFMTSYRGYHQDWLWGNLAALFAVCVTLFPTTKGCDDPIGWSRLHSISALLYFGVLTYFSGFLFTRSDRPPGHRTPRKLLRNAIYRTCAVVMAGCIVTVMVYEFKAPCDESNHLVFWAESTAIMAFGLSWFVKGGLVLGDR